MEQAIGAFLQASAATLSQAGLAAEGFETAVGQLSGTALFAAASVVLLLQALGIAALVHQRRRLLRAQEDVTLLAGEITRINQELNVERLWRLAGTQNPELPEETLKKLYRVVTDERLAS